MAVAVFRGPVAAGMRPSALFTKIGASSGALLFYRRDDRSRLIGNWPGHGTPIVASGDSFKLWTPPSEPIPRNITPPVGAEFVGEWYSGGADCMKIFPRARAGVFSVKAWYCNAGEPEFGINSSLTDGQMAGDDGTLLIKSIGTPCFSSSTANGSRNMCGWPTTSASLNSLRNERCASATAEAARSAPRHELLAQ